MKRSWWQRRRPVPVHVEEVTMEDVRTASAWDMTLDEWFALTEQERRDKRFHLALAPKLVTA